MDAHQSDRFVIEGTKEEAVFALCNLGIENASDAERILDFLSAHQELVSDTELLLAKEPEDSPNHMEMTFGDTSYYVNIKTTTIVMAAFLLDIMLTKGLAATALSLLGAPTGPVFHVIDEQNGEKCILREVIRVRKGTEELLATAEGMCIYPQSRCKFRDRDFCNCGKSDVVHIMESLCKKNIMKKDLVTNTFIYQW